MEVKTIMTAGAQRALLARADELADTTGPAGEITQTIGRAPAAPADAGTARHDLARAQAMTVHNPCQGCHGARDYAIGTAQRALDDAREREDLAGAALEILAPLPRTLGAALRAVERLPEDLHDTYAAVYDLVTADPKAMPGDGDFITGTAAAMAAQL